MSGGAAPALVRPSNRGTNASGAFAWHQRVVAAGLNPLARGDGRLLAARLGPMVAGAGGILRLHVAPRDLAFPWLAPRQPPAATAGAGFELGHRRRPGCQAGKVVRP